LSSPLQKHSLKDLLQKVTGVYISALPAIVEQHGKIMKEKSLLRACSYPSLSTEIPKLKLELFITCFPGLHKGRKVILS